MKKNIFIGFFVLLVGLIGVLLYIRLDNSVDISTTEMDPLSKIHYLDYSIMVNNKDLNKEKIDKDIETLIDIFKLCGAH